MIKVRTITAAVVTSRERGYGPEILAHLAISQEDGIKVDAFSGDGEYLGKEIAFLTFLQNIDFVARLISSNFIGM